MKFVVVRTNTEREITVVGKAASKDEASTILKKDFEKYFWGKVGCSKDLAFEESYKENHGPECTLSEDNAWLNGCGHTDYAWQLLDTETKDVLSEPLTMKQMVLATSDLKWYVEGNVSVDLDEVIGCGPEEFFALLSTKLAGTSLLADVNYKLIDADPYGDAILRVSGDATGILYLEEDMVEELKKNIFYAGADAMEAFLGCALSFSTDEDMLKAMDDVLAKMPTEVQLYFYRKYVNK